MLASHFVLVRQHSVYCRVTSLPFHDGLCFRTNNPDILLYRCKFFVYHEMYILLLVKVYKKFIVLCWCTNWVIEDGFESLVSVWHATSSELLEPRHYQFWLHNRFCFPASPLSWRVYFLAHDHRIISYKWSDCYGNKYDEVNYHV